MTDAISNPFLNLSEKVPMNELYKPADQALIAQQLMSEQSEAKSTMHGSDLKSMLLASTQIQGQNLESQRTSSQSEPIRNEQDANLLLNLLRNQMGTSNLGTS